MRRLAIAGIALAFGTSAAGQSLNAEVDRLGASEFRIRITFPGEVTPPQAQAMLADVATQLCGAQAPTWRHYEFQTQTPGAGSPDAATHTRFSQDLVCGDGAAVAKPGAPAPATPPSEADHKDAAARTLDYLVIKDRSDFAAADAMFMEEVIAGVDRARWRDERRIFNGKSGLPASRQVVAVTFYDDPADAPRLGRYAAVDYRADYAQGAFYCGYVVWLRQADGAYRLIREDETIAASEDVRHMTEAQKSSIAPQPGCKAAASARK